MIRDCHTHNPDACEAVINVAPGFDAPQEGKLYSAGIHPWNAAETTQDDFNSLARMAREPWIAAIGEAGLDKLRGASLSTQSEIFERQALLADEVGKPLIIHCVRCWSELLAIMKRLRPKSPWIIHGFRGKPELAKQLLEAGCYISLPPKHNSATAAIIPADRLLWETDDDTTVPSTSLPITDASRKLFGGEETDAGGTAH